MTDSEFLLELSKRKALIVHCSRLGKANDGEKLFPEDLQTASKIFANNNGELSCSLVWPSHIETFGAIGIVLKPRSTKSISKICTTDGGTYVNPHTGKREGCGANFSKQAVENTFENPTTYNDWVVQDAYTIGMFVHPTNPWQVAKRVSAESMPGYDPQVQKAGLTGDQIAPSTIKKEQIAKHFPDQPIYSFHDGEIVRLDPLKESIEVVKDLYGIS